MYLLQLVQALKFESAPTDARVPRSSSLTNLPQNQDSGLADFLVTRGVQNHILGNRLHWYIMVELENKSTAKIYGRVAYKYQTKLMEVSCFLMNI